MPDTFVIQQGDTLPAFTAVLQDEVGPVNLTGAAVVLRIDGILEETMTITTPLTGAVSYAWQAGDTDTPGFYAAQIVVTFSDNSVLTFPNDGYHVVHITPALSSPPAPE